MKNSIFIKRLQIIIILCIYCAIDMQVLAQSDTTRFVFTEFMAGTVKMKNGLTGSAMMNYDKLNEEMLFVDKGIKLALDSLEIIDTVTIESRIFIPHQNIFFELLVKGPVSLFVQHKSKPIVGGSPSGYGGSTQTGAAKSVSVITNDGNSLQKLKLPGEFDLSDDTQFWIRKDNKFYKSNSRSQVIRAFPGKAKEIKQFIKENNLDLEKTDDQINLIVKCNEFVH